MRRRRNPFYVLLGLVGFLFAITATSYCLAALRLTRPAPRATVVASVHPLHAIMDRHGAGILAAELLVLGIATVGAVWLDHLEGERIRARRAAERAPSGRDGTPVPGTAGAEQGSGLDEQFIDGAGP
jgi:hypothetical protein